MNFEFFAAKRIIASKDYKSSVSSPIIKIAIAAIALGVAIMLISVATTLGLQTKIREKVSAFNGHIIISNFDANSSDESENPISKDQTFYPSFQEVEEVDHIQITASKGGVIRTANNFEGVIVKGVGNDYRWEYFEDFLTQGRLPDYSGNLNDEILISEYVANRLLLQVDDRINIFFLKDASAERIRPLGLTIVGIYNSGFQEFDEQFVIADIRHIQRLNKWKPSQIGSFEVFVDDFSDIQAIGAEVYQNIPSNLDAITIRDKYYSIFEWIDLFDFNLYLIIGIMIFISGINMITALLVLILERTQMIGILKALGAADSSIRKIFLYNATYIISRGLLIGNILGIGIILAQHYGKFIKLDPTTYYVTEAPVFLDIPAILLLNIGTLLLCLLMLLRPSYLVAKISPVKAIRFE